MSECQKRRSVASSFERWLRKATTCILGGCCFSALLNYKCYVAYTLFCFVGTPVLLFISLSQAIMIMCISLQSRVLNCILQYGCFFSEFSPHFLYGLSLSFLFLPRSLLRNHTETLPTQASWRAFLFFFFVGPFFVFFLTLSDIFKICILFVCTPHVNFMNNLIYCNNSMFCIACEIKICSHMDYQKAFLRLTAIPAVGIAVNHK